MENMFFVCLVKNSGEGQEIDQVECK